MVIHCFIFLLVLFFSDSFKSVRFCHCFHDHKFSYCVVLSNKIESLSRCQQKLNMHYTSIFWFANSDQHCRKKNIFCKVKERQGNAKFYLKVSKKSENFVFG